MSLTPTLDVFRPPAAPADTPERARPFRVLLIPNGQRTLITMLLWSFVLALYSRAMEMLGIDASHRYGRRCISAPTSLAA